MKLTDFFIKCASALKTSFLGLESENQLSNQEVTLTDNQALEMFAEIRKPALSHKSERGSDSACDLRTHAIYEIFAERGIRTIGKG